jgi:hypothetical protein
VRSLCPTPSLSSSKWHSMIQTSSFAHDCLCHLCTNLNQSR